MLDCTINLKVNEGKEAAVIPPVEESGEPHVVVDNDAWGFDSAEKKFQLADTLTDPLEKLEMQRSAINDLKEGAYMTAKDADNFVIPIDVARKDVNGGLLVSERLQRAIEHCRLVDKENLDVSQLELRIKSEGYGSFNELATDLGDTMRRVGSAKIGE